MVRRIACRVGILVVAFGVGCGGDSSNALDVVGDTAPVPDKKCLPGIPCVRDADCPNGHHCNTAANPPECQKLYCGGFQSACSEDELCLSQQCDGGKCAANCSGLECGPDPVYGASCGTCSGGSKCESGNCVCKPQDHKGCCGNNVCWKDSCGNDGAVLESCPLACIEGSCVGCDAVGKADCSGTCKWLRTDSDCSRCGDVCLGGKTCQVGQCQCPDGQGDCSGTCKLLGTNSDCSACGDVCLGGKTCQEGSCKCSTTQQDCSGTCKLLGTNSDCSACGDVCLGGKTCWHGLCAEGVGSCKWLHTVCFEPCYSYPSVPQQKACLDECSSLLTPDGKLAATAFSNCMSQNSCWNDSTGKCIDDYCLHEYFECFSGDTYTTCAQLTACVGACPADDPSTTGVNENASCAGDCMLEATVQALEAYYALWNCVLTQCPVCSTDYYGATCQSCITSVIGGSGPCKSLSAACS
jgi:hypothetical protein